MFPIQCILGLGGFATVKKVRAKGSGSTFALKCIDKCKLISDSDWDTVSLEKQIISQVHDPFLVNFVTTFQDVRYLYMMCEYVEAGDMRTLAMSVNGNRFKDKETKFFIACTTLALQALHKENIIYRDLKPENILLCKDGFLKLTDFGNSKKVTAKGKTYTMCGTPDCKLYQ